MLELFQGLDQRVIWLALTAALAGLVRGFSGFGAAMVFIPIVSVLYEPKVAVVVLFLVDLIPTAPLMIRSFFRCTWREVLPLLVGATITVPLGVRLLVVSDVVVLRWGISLAIMVIVAVMAVGWRYERRPSMATSTVIGGASGLAGGIAGLYGPPIVLFWLSGKSSVDIVRYNIFAFFGLISVVMAVSYWMNSLFTMYSLLLAALAMPAYAVSIFFGSRFFGLASDAQFRYVALFLCGIISIGTLPLWERPF